MLKKTLTISTLVVLLSVSSMARGNHGGNGHSKKNNPVETIELSDVQKEGLIFMVEEEKVARDVYLKLADTWDAKVFSNIASSEQTHIDSVEKLLNNYNLEVPTTMETEGVFENEELQAMYDDLIAQGSSSLTDALEVGVAIEETDISDLETLLDEEIPADIEKVYGDLLGGSFNHLNAFNRQLAK
jgi:hypothetical protein